MVPSVMSQAPQVEEQHAAPEPVPGLHPEGGPLLRQGSALRAAPGSGERHRQDTRWVPRVRAGWNGRILLHYGIAISLGGPLKATSVVVFVVIVVVAYGMVPGLPLKPSDNCLF